jgi:hypothetical protein
VKSEAKSIKYVVIKLIDEVNPNALVIGVWLERDEC